jgi:guanine deaminase
MVIGKQLDATWLRPQPRSTLDIVLRHAADADDALAKIFALGTSADVAGVWVGGRHLHSAFDELSPYSRPKEAA